MARPFVVSKYCLHKPSNRAFVYVRRRKVYLGPYGSEESKAEYRRILAELEAKPKVALAPTTLKALPDLTVNELADAYLDHVADYYRKPSGEPTSEAALVGIALGPLMDLYGLKIANEFGPIALKAVRQSMIDKGWTRKSINRQINRVVRLFKWAVENELVAGMVLNALRAVGGLRPGRSGARESLPVRPVDDETVDATLPHLSSVVAAMVRVQRLTGMRPGEVCQMRPCDLDRSRPLWVYSPPTHKTEHYGKERQICIGPKAQTILAPILAGKSDDALVFSPAEATAEMRRRRSEARKTPLNEGNRPGTNRKPIPMVEPRPSYTTTTYARAVRRACEKKWPTKPAKKVEPVPPEVVATNMARHWHPNQLRHAAATEVRKRFGLEAAQLILGHSNAVVTQVYAERDAARAEEIAARVG
jgi:integrase